MRRFFPVLRDHVSYLYRKLYKYDRRVLERCINLSKKGVNVWFFLELVYLVWYFKAKRLSEMADRC